MGFSVRDSSKTRIVPVRWNVRFSDECGGWEIHLRKVEWLSESVSLKGTCISLLPDSSAKCWKESKSLSDKLSLSVSE